MELKIDEQDSTVDTTLMLTTKEGHMTIMRIFSEAKGRCLSKELKCRDSVTICSEGRVQGCCGIAVGGKS